MEENEYKSTYQEIASIRCAFEKALTNNRARCSYARHFWLADREGYACKSTECSAKCHELLTKLRENSRFLLKLPQAVEKLPHNMEIRVQAGGINGIRALFSAAPEQVVDDILDFTGNERQLGKPVINDLKEGRITLPIIHALAHASEVDHRRLRDLAQEVKPEIAPDILALLKKNGSLDYAREQARHFTLKAQENLKVFPESLEKSYFWAITEELLQRTH